VLFCTQRKGSTLNSTSYDIGSAPSPLDEIVQQARERAQAALDESSKPVRGRMEADLFDDFDDIL
jgi:hypothetical protein